MGYPVRESVGILKSTVIFLRKSFPRVLSYPIMAASGVWSSGSLCFAFDDIRRTKMQGLGGGPERNKKVEPRSGSPVCSLPEPRSFSQSLRIRTQGHPELLWPVAANTRENVFRGEQCRRQYFLITKGGWTVLEENSQARLWEGLVR